MSASPATSQVSTGAQITLSLLKLGEQVTLNFLREIVQTYNEDTYFTFHGFDGVSRTITKEGFF